MLSTFKKKKFNLREASEIAWPHSQSSGPEAGEDLGCLVPDRVHRLKDYRRTDTLKPDNR